MPRHAADARTRMHAAAAEEQAFDGGREISERRRRPERTKTHTADIDVVDIAMRYGKTLFEIVRRHHAATDFVLQQSAEVGV